MNIKNEIAVGIFFFIGFLIIGYYTIILSGEIFESHEYYSMSIAFPSIEGLAVSDKVKVNGVVSGNVVDINLKDNKVFVNLKMYKKFLLYENYKISIKNETTLGGKYVRIYPGCEYENKKHFSLIQTKKNLHGSAIEDPIGLISEVIEENRENIYQTINNIRQITENVNKGKGTLGKLINDPIFHDNTDDLITEIREVIEDTREQAPVTGFIRAALSAF